MRWLAAVVLVCCACDSGNKAKLPEASGSAAVLRGSAGGFSASLSADLAGDTPASSGGSAGSAMMPMKADAGVATAGDASAVAVKTPADAAAAVAMSPADAAAATAVKTPPDRPGSDDIAIDEPKPAKGPVKPPPELAAIKFELLPNWDRDIGQAGTIVLDVKIQGGTERRSFTFHYGYDDPRAPTDRDAYKKFLGEQKILAVDLDRQRGAAWYLEGADASGKRAFRYLVTYGGKHLICYGSLYKDAAGNALGDLRDEVVIQAKKICESLSL
jgi:hypothetical protein